MGMGLKIMKIMPKEQYVRMKNFMMDNNVGINSKHNLFTWARKIAIDHKGACICNPKSKPICPCLEALREIELDNHCACRLFGNNNSCSDCDKNCKLQFNYTN